ncbi:MAG: hypothetical protein F2754_10620 [Actinobacteria bacterium]|uniref:Unannotated protein n=1 Tax=freshwater metagenome TaxID=449393 RepID=A0A6J7AP93_9ZZZZ|nr:hypothetical protein [Actinomycetota bacterium]MSW92986.1 hypothetical protein [Actinomycetota bacterium]MSX87829.1 hypothetical protein [Actinomycetota bacterium]MSY72877.1 hypothetical protein [Actinomycetota bacterium]
MGTDRPDDRVPPRDPAVPEPPAVPAFEWVFGSNTVLGGVTPGHRNVRHNGKLSHYAPWGEIGGGARWCSRAWLDRHRGRRGFLARTQSGVSLMAMHVSGAITSGTVVVVPDEQLDAAAALAARLLAPDIDAESGLWEWSTAVVREPGRSRLAVRIVPRFDDDVYHRALAVFAAELDVEWFIVFRPGHDRMSVGDHTIKPPDVCTVHTADGTIAAHIDDGLIYLEDEPVPARLVELAAKHGNGLALVGRWSPGIHVRPDSYRSLEPDEWHIDRDYARWVN